MEDAVRRVPLISGEARPVARSAPLRCNQSIGGTITPKNQLQPKQEKAVTRGSGIMFFPPTAYGPRTGERAQDGRAEGEKSEELERRDGPRMDRRSITGPGRPRGSRPRGVGPGDRGVDRGAGLAYEGTARQDAEAEADDAREGVEERIRRGYLRGVHGGTAMTGAPEPLPPRIVCNGRRTSGMAGVPRRTRRNAPTSNRRAEAGNPARTSGSRRRQRKDEIGRCFR